MPPPDAEQQRIRRRLGYRFPPRAAYRVELPACSSVPKARQWPITLKTGHAEQAIGGLHRIDEAALSALADDAFLKLRKASALPIAYGQMLSMGQLGVFENLAKLHAQLAQTAVAALPESIDKLLEMPSDDIVRFR